MNPDRRRFFQQAALGPAAAIAAGGVSIADGPPKAAPRRNPIGVSTYSFWQFRGERLDISTCIDKAAAMGFDGVEILHVQMKDESARAINGLKRQAHSLGLALMGFSTHQGFVSPDEDVRRTNVQKTLYQIDLAYEARHPHDADQHRPLGHDQVIRRLHGQEGHRAAGRRSLRRGGIRLGDRRRSRSSSRGPRSAAWSWA